MALEVALLSDGILSELATIFSGVRTTLLSNEGQRFRVRQEDPSVGMIRESDITISLNRQLPAHAFGPLRTPTGSNVYQLERTAAQTPSGTEQRLSYFFPYDELPPAVLSQLGVSATQRRYAAVEQLISYRAAQTTGLGAVVSAVVTSSGNTGTRAPGSPPLGSDTTVPGNSGQRYTLSEADLAHMQRTNEIIRSSNLDRQACEAADRARHLDEQWAARRAEAQARAQARMDAELAHSSQHNPVGRATSVAVAGYELWNTLSDWLCDTNELDALDECQANPTNPLTQTASASERQNAARAVSDARGDVNAISAARVGLTGVTTAGSLTVGGTPGLAMDLVSLGAGASLAEAQRARMSGVRASVVRCGPIWVSATVSYSYSLTFVNDPPTRGAANDRGTVTERADGTVSFGIDGRGSIVQARGTGAWRSGEDGTYDCIRYGYRIAGNVQVGAQGGPTGFEQPGLGNRGQATQLFSLDIDISGKDLEYEIIAGQAYGRSSVSTPWGYVCEPGIGQRTQDGSAGTLCTFEDVPLLAGGTFFDRYTRADRDNLNRVEVRSCRIEVRPGTPPTPVPTPVRPDPCAPGRRC